MKKINHTFFDEIFQFVRINSTTKEAINCIQSKKVSGNFIILADEQKGGIGRKSNYWYSPKGGLWFTMGIYGLSVNSNFTIHTGIVLHKTLADIFPEIDSDLKIKWPNDIFLKNKKVAGILSSYYPAKKYHLIGIGLDVNIIEFPNELKNIAISLKLVLQRDVDIYNVLYQFLDKFSELLPEFIETGFDLHYFSNHDQLSDKEITIDIDFANYTGICKGIDKNGAILLQLKSGILQPFIYGTILDY
ncbi:MAG: biotin--[acetyl-CoA-carboxylase] ligase [Candidatus Cloacimonetes bacterium]|nr:biotin--[acetyl-CoA-carboxylase] ligase [Candidatus Cloacimonadota bacterium]